MKILLGTLTLLAAATTIPSLTGCGAVGSAEDAAGDAIDSAQVDGDYSGTWKNQSGEGGVTSIHLEQHGLAVSGTITFASNQCLSQATVRAWVDREGVHGTLDAGDAHLRFEAGISGTEFHGIYESLVAGPCEGERGTLWFVR